jgi:hypothetical protein
MVHRRCYRDIVRWATVALLLLVGCSDLRDFHGTWSGPRVGDATPLKVGVQDGDATLAIDAIDTHGLMARLTVDGLITETPIASLEGAEADVLAGITFSGAPLRVYLAFTPVPDRGGDALVVVALYDDRRVEVRLLRGGSAPLYGIYAMREVVAVSSRTAAP